ncbi:QRFP-like peptide receptor [Tachypleus tridentatus]|uniref:QRFP-like peptide receptor n=1 Tax=Tachypleus tridentatus TaxID=6853 RepID=UPI003FD2EC5A
MDINKSSTQTTHFDLFELSTLANHSSVDSDYPSSFKRFVLPVVYIVLFLLVIGSSLMVVMTIVVRKSLHRPMNFYVVSLSVSDCFIAIVIVSVNLYSSFNTVSANFSCILFRCSYFAEIALCNSIFSVVAVALDRHNAIVRPLQDSLTNRRALHHVAVIWLLSILYSFPKYVVATVRHYKAKAMINLSDHEVLNYCMFRKDVALGINFLDILVVYLFPLVTVTILYSRAVRVLRQCEQKNTPYLQILNRRRRRAIKMIIIITIIFAVSWLPYHVLSIISREPFRGMSSVMVETRNVFRIMSVVLILLNGWLNVVVYGYLNEGFRLAFRSLLRKCFSRGRITSSIRQRFSSSATLTSFNLARNSKVSMQPNVQVCLRKTTWPLLTINKDS